MLHRCMYETTPNLINVRPRTLDTRLIPDPSTPLISSLWPLRNGFYEMRQWQNKSLTCSLRLTLRLDLSWPYVRYQWHQFKVPTVQAGGLRQDCGAPLAHYIAGLTLLWSDTHIKNCFSSGRLCELCNWGLGHGCGRW